MAYTLTKRPNYAVEITASLDPETVERERAGIAGSVRRRARIPGFRPGKAPLGVVQARFSEEIAAELKEHLAEHVWQEVVEGEDDLRPLTSPRVTAAEFGPDGGFTLTAELETRPRFDLPEPESLTLPEIPVEVEPAEVDAELERLREEQAVWEPADDETIEDGVLVEADLAAEFPEGGAEPFRDENARFEIGAEALFPEISEALRGARVGEQRTAERRFADDHQDEALRGKPIRYQITVKAVKRKGLPEVDDDLARAVGLESLEELRDRIATALAERRRGERRSQWRRALLDQLAANIDANDLPATVVRAALNDDMQRVAYSMAMRGVDPGSGEVDWQEISAKLEPGSRKRALDTLIMEQLGEQWEVAVPEAEVDLYIRGEATRHGVPPAEHKANLAREGRLEGIRDAARLAAVVDELIRRAGGEEAP